MFRPSLPVLPLLPFLSLLMFQPPAPAEATASGHFSMSGQQVHIYNLIGFRNRLTVITQWAFAYLTYQRSVRLITHERDAGGPS